MMIIAVVGLARSGKDTLAYLLSQRFGFERFDFYRDVIVPLMQAQGIEPSKQNAARFGNEMRAKFGMGVFGKKMAEIVKGKERVVVTGARSLEELKHLEEIAQMFYIIKVEAPEQQRFERRSELDSSEKKAFFKRDLDDLQNKGLQGVLKAADFSIDNSGSLQELEERLESLMERIK